MFLIVWAPASSAIDFSSNAEISLEEKSVLLILEEESICFNNNVPLIPFWHLPEQMESRPQAQ